MRYSLAILALFAFAAIACAHDYWLLPATFTPEVGKPVSLALHVGDHFTTEGEKAHQAVNKSRTWVTTLMGVVAWFWGLATTRIEEWGLSEEQEQAVKEKLLAGHYWAMAAGRARSAE